ncbi:hypothetical protein VZT92_014778 [Zoarces viviparus]|uniref:Uncharacterized protein n=1 Tax=Zoarces viviparus TaxID=48416 RepID=A0AAW1F130_ZOAVI
MKLKAQPGPLKGPICASSFFCRGRPCTVRDRDREGVICVRIYDSSIWPMHRQFVYEQTTCRGDSRKLWMLNCAVRPAQLGLLPINDCVDILRSGCISTHQSARFH